MKFDLLAATHRKHPPVCVLAKFHSCSPPGAICLYRSPCVQGGQAWEDIIRQDTSCKMEGGPRAIPWGTSWWTSPEPLPLLWALRKPSGDRTFLPGVCAGRFRLWIDHGGHICQSLWARWAVHAWLYGKWRWSPPLGKWGSYFASGPVNQRDCQWKCCFSKTLSLSFLWYHSAHLNVMSLFIMMFVSSDMAVLSSSSASQGWLV